jgi:inner membrane transporter RhtA
MGTTASTSSLRRSVFGVPPTGLAMIGMLSVQLGSTIAKGLFASVGPQGASFLRLALAAVVLLAVWRPTLRGHTRRALAFSILFGLDVALMNLSFYAAIDRIPLGIAVTIEFIGPLGVAVIGSRRALDLLWVALAAAGILLLAPWGGVHLDGLGVLFGLCAGACWATYIYLSAEVGREFPGSSGLTFAMVVGGLALLPIGIATAGTHLISPSVLLAGLGVALLASVIPYTCELEALRRLSTRVFGVLMSLEPAIAAVVGFLILHQVFSARALGAIVLVTTASAGASRTGSHPPID